MFSYEFIYLKCRENGGYLHESVVRKKVNGIYGMFATKDIPKETLILKIPFHYTLDIKTFNNLDMSLMPSELSVKAKFAYILYLEYKKDKSSKFYDWFQCLPTQEECKQNPLVLSQKKLDIISKVDKTFSKELKNRKEKLNKCVNKIKKFDKNCDSKIYKYLYIIVMTRTWSSPHKNYNLRPVLDMFNHSGSGTYPKTNYDDELYEFSVGDDVKEGDQIYIIYASFSTLIIYKLWGFIDNKNLQSIHIDTIELESNVPDNRYNEKDLQNMYGGKCILNRYDNKCSLLMHGNFVFTMIGPNNTLKKSLELYYHPNSKNILDKILDTIDNIEKQYNFENLIEKDFTTHIKSLELHYHPNSKNILDKISDIIDNIEKQYNFENLIEKDFTTNIKSLYYAYIYIKNIISCSREWIVNNKVLCQT